MVSFLVFFNCFETFAFLMVIFGNFGLTKGPYLRDPFLPSRVLKTLRKSKMSKQHVEKISSGGLIKWCIAEESVSFLQKLLSKKH